MSETIAIEWLKSPNKAVQHIRTIFPNGRSSVGNARDQAASVFKYLAENHRLDFSGLNKRIQTAFGWGIIFSREKQELHTPHSVGYDGWYYESVKSTPQKIIHLFIACEIAGVNLKMTMFP